MLPANPPSKPNETSGATTRRKFLITSGTALASLSLSGCFSLSGTKAAGARADDLLDDALRAQMLALLEETCRWIATIDFASGESKLPKKKSSEMWSNANLARVLISSYKISGRPEYLGEALRWLDFLVRRQQRTTTATGLDAGFWGNQTGPGNLYLADTGTAMSALALGYKLADRARQKNYLAAMERFARFVQFGSNADPQGLKRGSVTSWIIREGKDKGALGCGYYQGKLSASAYIIATSLTKVEFPVLLQAINHDSNWTPILQDGVRWILAQQLPTGEFPYIINGQPLDPKDWPLDTLTYVSEGLIAAYLYSDDTKLRRDIAQTLKASVAWLLRTQNENGTWGKMQSYDQQRSPGCVTLLAWYYRNVTADPRIAASVRRYCHFLSDSKNRTDYGYQQLFYTTGFIGLVLANLLKPNVIFE